MHNHMLVATVVDPNVRLIWIMQHWGEDYYEKAVEMIKALVCTVLLLLDSFDTAKLLKSQL
jgi:hypothetical protein